MVPARLLVTYNAPSRRELCASWLERLAPNLRAYITRRHGYINKADHEDVLQEAYIAFMGNPMVTGSGYHGDLCSRNGVLSYLQAACSIAARNHLQSETGVRDSKKAIQLVSLDSPETVQELEEIGVEDSTEEDIDAAEVYHFILQGLPDTLQILVDRYYVKHETLDSIRETMGYRTKTEVLRRLWMARKLLVPRLMEVKRLRREGKF